MVVMVVWVTVIPILRQSHIWVPFGIGRVARRISFTTCSAGAFAGPVFCLIFVP